MAGKPRRSNIEKRRRGGVFTGTDRVVTHQVADDDGKAVLIVPRREKRSDDHPHHLNTAGQPDIRRHPSPVPEKHARRPKLSEAVDRNLATLAVVAPGTARTEVEIVEGLVDLGVRRPFAALIAHKEIAAAVLAAGGTYVEAADRAGVSEHTVAGYYEDMDLRARIDELRALLLSEVQGRSITDLRRRTEPGMIEDLDVGDLLRIYDRTTPGGRAGAKGGTLVTGPVSITNDFRSLAVRVAAAVEVPDATEEGEDLPGSGFDIIPLPSGDAPGD